MKRLLALTVMIASGAVPALAQRGSARAAKPAVTHADSARANLFPEPVANAVILSTEPNSVRVVAIDVPAEVLGRKGHYVFVRQTQFSVQGHLEGALTADSLQGPIVLNVSVPAAAPAGRTIVGTMQFTCDDQCAAISIPVYVDVQAHSALQVDPARPLLGAHAGARVATDLVVRNMGNATEPVTLTLLLPNDWRSRILVTVPISMAAGTTMTVPIEINVADDAGMGDYGVEMEVSSPAGGNARGAFTVRIGAGQKGAVGWRPMLEANAGVAHDEAGNTAAAYGADLTGEIFPGITANGRASYLRDADGLPALTQRSLGRLGYSSGNNSYLLLNAPHWGAGGGILGLSNAGIAGNGLWGEGGTGHVTTDAWRGSAFEVEPASGGHFFVGDAAHRYGPAWTGLVVSDLREEGLAARYAQTVAASVEVPLQDGDMLVQAGRRASDTTQGIAWLAHFQRHTRDWSFNVLASHAPLGASAFAQAEDQYQVDGYRKVTTRLSVGGSVWGNRDGGISGNSDFSSDGWSLSPQLAIGRWGSVSLETRASKSTGKSDVGSFGNVDDDVTASWLADLAQIQTRVGVTRGTLERTSSVSNDLSVDAKATRYAMFASASSMTRYGTWQLDVTDEHTGVGVGVPSQQLSVAARLDQIPLLTGRAYLRAEVLTYYLGATGSTSLSQVLGLDVHLGNSYRLSVDAEHNNLQLNATGNASWVISTKLRRAIGLPALRNAALHGVVFADLNGNGKRDRNEHGMGGAVVLIDGVPVTTDAQGRFGVGVSRTALMEVDPRSLPMGWMAGQRPLSFVAHGDVELAVIPTSPVDVSLRLATKQGVDTNNVHFEKAVIVLTDSTGRRWTGGPDAHGLLRFDALPPGVYEVSADLSGVGEKLILPDILPQVRVEGAGDALKVELLVGPRKIRITPPPPGSHTIESGSTRTGGSR